jgi:hypothetical protein
MQPSANQKVAPMSTPTNEKSGKRLILGVLVIGLAAAAASWWFRYSATHRAAEFWGPQAATLIRDAAHVTLRSDASSDDPRDISNAPGLTHLRAALLEDSSFDWSAAGSPDTNWDSSLVFEESEGAEPRAVILFSPDFHWVANGSSGDPAKHVVATSSEFAAGLTKFFTELPPVATTE